ncbi:MAG TPA: hypothetical protein VG963_32580 [Polyangiaceae bacterium]|nr:hypothetical protein [Polyangiaceae bacterium]
MAQQKLQQVLARDPLCILCIVARALQIAHSFARLIVNAVRGQVTTTQKARELHGITPVRLHPIT